uniref:Uncharacterized protein n=1 Tax=Anguilla anguilla TaxID=7936 RepID=A0A0E9PZK6_ANGAN
MRTHIENGYVPRLALVSNFLR